VVVGCPWALRLQLCRARWHVSRRRFSPQVPGILTEGGEFVLPRPKMAVKSAAATCWPARQMAPIRSLLLPELSPIEARSVRLKWLIEVHVQNQAMVEHCPRCAVRGSTRTAHGPGWQ
jgi:hypothetical protein